MYLSDIFTTPANLTGVTATAVPSGAGADGLPLSLQILGPRFGEAAVFRAARAFERKDGLDRHAHLPERGGGGTGA